jgi:hypothetical protein
VGPINTSFQTIQANKKPCGFSAGLNTSTPAPNLVSQVLWDCTIRRSRLNGVGCQSSVRIKSTLNIERRQKLVLIWHNGSVLSIRPPMLWTGFLPQGTREAQLYLATTQPRADSSLRFKFLNLAHEWHPLGAESYLNPLERTTFCTPPASTSLPLLFSSILHHSISCTFIYSMEFCAIVNADLITSHPTRYSPCPPKSNLLMERWLLSASSLVLLAVHPLLAK